MPINDFCRNDGNAAWNEPHGSGPSTADTATAAAIHASTQSHAAKTTVTGKHFVMSAHNGPYQKHKNYTLYKISKHYIHIYVGIYVCM